MDLQKDKKTDEMLGEISFEKKINEELTQLTFTRQEHVLKRTHPTTLKDKLIALWNKELEFSPLTVAVAALAGVIIMVGISMDNKLISNDASSYQMQLVEAGGNVYWDKQYEGRMKLYEQKNKD